MTNIETKIFDEFTLIFKIPYLPDIGMPKYTHIYENPRSAIIEKHNELLVILKEMSEYYKLRFSLRYTFSPENDAFEKIGVFLIFKSDSPEILDKVRKVILFSTLSEFYKFEEFIPEENDPFFYKPDWASTIGELIKKEEKILPLRALSEERIEKRKLPHYYFINRISAKVDNDMSSLIKALNNLNKKCAFEVILERTKLSVEKYAITEKFIDSLKVESFPAETIELLSQLINQDFYSNEDISDAIDKLEIPHLTSKEKQEIILLSQTVSEKELMERLIYLLSELKNVNIIKKEFTEDNNTKTISDLNIDDVKTSFNGFIKDYIREDIFLFSIRFLCEDEFSVNLLMNNFAVSTIEEHIYRPVLFHKDQDIFKDILKSYINSGISRKVYWKYYWNNYDESRLYRPLARLHRMISLKEVKGFFRLPIPSSDIYNGIGIETDEIKNERLPGVFIGKEEERIYNSFSINLNQLNKHMFIVGVPGSGKTTAVINILVQLWCDHGIPFIVIEPAKTEYRALKFINSKPEELKAEFGKSFDLKFEGQSIRNFILNNFSGKLGSTLEESLTNKNIDNEDNFWVELAKAINQYTAPLRNEMYIITAGRESLLPFRFNPFQLIEGIDLFEHISNLEQAFKSSIDLGEGGPLPALLSEAIEDIYYDKGWIGGKFPSRGNEFPTMEDLYNKLATLIESKGYDKEIKGNLLTALEVRIGTFLRRNVGKMFNTQELFPNISEILNKPVVMELDALNEYQANLTTMFLLTFIQEYVKVNRKSGSNLKHVVVIEEAHNIIGNDSKKEGIDTKGEATKHVVKMLAEMRALGEGFIIADQLPSAVSPYAIKNTNIKLTHRMVSNDDIEVLYNSMQMDQKQMENLPRFRPGQSVMFQEGWYKARSVIEPNTKAIFGISETVSNNELVSYLENESLYKDLKAYTDKEEQSLLSKLESELNEIYKSEERRFEEKVFPLSIDKISTDKNIIKKPEEIKVNSNKYFQIDSYKKEFESKLKKFDDKIKSLSLSGYLKDTNSNLHKDYEQLKSYEYQKIFTETSCEILRQYHKNIENKDLHTVFTKEDLERFEIYNSQVELERLLNNNTDKSLKNELRNKDKLEERLIYYSDKINQYCLEYTNLLFLINKKFPGNFVKNVNQISLEESFEVLNKIPDLANDSVIRFYYERITNLLVDFINLIFNFIFNNYKESPRALKLNKINNLLEILDKESIYLNSEYKVLLSGYFSEINGNFCIKGCKVGLETDFDLKNGLEILKSAGE